MDKIKGLFDPSKDIYRRIEKVITYDASQENSLKAEISEYVATESIEDQFEKLLTRMQIAMEAEGENEVGVWVSGFYGSGKSSFTKYLGLSFAQEVQVDGIPFVQHLQNRLTKPQARALLSTVPKRFPAAVVLLDLASEMLAGATMEDVSTVLFYKVLQFAGYSRNLKVAALERRLQKDGRYDEFKQNIEDAVNVPWSTVQNDPLVVDSIIPEIAHQMYPKLFKAPTSFSTETSDFVQFENERVQEMLDIVRAATGKEHILFIIDEVGQYIAPRQNLILNMDGLAKNLKRIGRGKVWIIGTAQQTLTEDDPRAALNSPALYKLKDRFPIQIDLESSDIREICTKRLLGKSTGGENLLSALFDQHGQALRQNTRLQDAKYYDSDFNKVTFTDLYPFLPAHFDILLHLLGALAKSTGGIGLRSAIKVVQDILIEGLNKQLPVAEQPVGWLATTVTLYDALEKDIRRAFPSIHSSVGKVQRIFSDRDVHQGVAKTVAILQILKNLPVTVHNVAALMHPAVISSGRKEDVKNAVEDLISDPVVPFGEQDGSLCFFSEKINDIEQERSQVPLRSIEIRRIRNEALKEIFTPLPSATLDGTLSVKSGLKAQTGSFVTGISGERETIQTVVELVDANEYQAARTRQTDESRQRSSRYTIYLLARNDGKIDDKIADIYRCHEICNRYRTEPDQEVKEYCTAQMERAAKLAGEVQHLVKTSLSKGSFVFQGQTTAVNTLDADVKEACRKHLSTVADQVFDRYNEAPVRAETSLAERFLRAGNLTAITAQIDPLGLVQVSGGTPQIRTDHKALISIRDHIERNGTVEGKQLIGHFTGPPFGWSPDTLRYLVAACLLAGEIKLKVSGREVTVNGQQAIDALKTNNAFKPVGVSLREGKPNMEVLARAAERLTELVGDMVVPLEQEISKAATKHLPRFQSTYAPLGEKLAALRLPGIERVESLNRDIADLLFTDASDAPERLGAEESSLYENLKWAGEVHSAFKQGLETTLRSIRRHCVKIKDLPPSGSPGQLRDDLSETIAQLEERLSKEDFYKHVADFNSRLTDMMARVRDTVAAMLAAQKGIIAEAGKDLQRLDEWSELTQEEQTDMLTSLEALQIESTDDLAGLTRLMDQQFVVGSQSEELKRRIFRKGQERIKERAEEAKNKALREGKKVMSQTLRMPKTLTSLDQLDELIQQLQELKKLARYNQIEVTIQTEN